MQNQTDKVCEDAVYHRLYLARLLSLEGRTESGRTAQSARRGNKAMPREMTYAYKQDHPFEKRAAEAARIREKYPDRIPVICEKEPRSDIAPVDKRKYLIPIDLTVGQFVYVIRKRISIPPEKAIFIFVNNILPPTAALMSSIYEEHKDEDGFLYIVYSGENTFG